MPVFIVDCDVNNPTSEKFTVNLSPQVMKSYSIPNLSRVLLRGRGSKRAICFIQKSKCEENKILINRVVRHNLGLLLGDAVTVEPIIDSINKATHVSLQSKGKAIKLETLKGLVRQYFQYGCTLCEGNEIILRGDNLACVLVVTKILPESCGIVDPSVTALKLSTHQEEEECRILTDPSYSGIGGQTKALIQLRKFECFMKFPSLFKAFNIQPPRIILHGSEGLGKLLMAKAFANETGAHFVLIDDENLESDDGKENISNISFIQNKFDEAIQKTPSVICINNLDLITPVELQTHWQKDIATNLIKSVRNLANNPNVILIGITTAVSKIHHSVFGLFLNSTTKTELIAFNNPDYLGRLEILKICTQNRTLENNFSINEIATTSDNYTAAQLAELCSKTICKSNIKM